MKLSLNELQVDSYATQVSENELTDIKGGSSAACWIYLLNEVRDYLSGEDGSDGAPDQGGHEVCPTTTTTVDGNGCVTTTTTTVVRG